MLRVLLRPKWLALLLVALVAAAVFAALGRWQLEAAIQSATPYEPDPALQSAVPIGEVIQPLEPAREAHLGQRVTMRGVLDPRDFDVVPGRLQGDREGYWLIGHLVVTDDGSGALPAADELGAEQAAARLPGLVVAIGWAADEGAARAAAQRLRDEAGSSPPDPADAVPYAGSLQLGQGPERPRDGDPRGLVTVAPAQLVNRWAQAPEHPYALYAVLELGDAERAGLEAIETRQAIGHAGLNWLNVFYAVEWIVFAGFAVFMWWRLARDEHERERAATGPAARARLAAELRRERLRAMRDGHRARDEDGRDPGTPPAG